MKDTLKTEARMLTSYVEERLECGATPSNLIAALIDTADALSEAHNEVRLLFHFAEGCLDRRAYPDVI